MNGEKVRDFYVLAFFCEIEDTFELKTLLNQVLM